MKCPNCSETLVMSERQGVEIDYCPKCRGVWLDRGELDKIIDKSMTGMSGSRQGQDFNNDMDDDDDDNFRQDKKGLNQDQGQQGRRKRRGFLGDFFDFD